MSRLYLFIGFMCCVVILCATDFVDLVDKEYDDLVKSQIGDVSYRAYTQDGHRFVIVGDAESDLMGYFIVSTDFAPVKGYSGTTSVGILLRPDFSVEKATIISSQETRAYVRRLNSMGYMQRFVGFNAGDEVDFISGATMTCRAIKESVDESIIILKRMMN